MADDALTTLHRRCELRLAELKSDRTQAEPEWRQLTQFLLPERGRYIIPQTARKPSASSSKILDPAATKAHGRLASFLMAGITNPALPWFNLGVGDDDLADDTEVREFFAECRKRMLRVLGAGTFYPALHQLYEEIGGFGTAAMLVINDFEDVLRFYPLTCGEYFLALNDRQEVDELFREYSMTVSQLVEKFGIDKVSPTVKNHHEARKYSAPIIVCHAIVPNRDRKAGRMGWEGKPYVGVYYERAHDGVLKTEGHAHRPFIAPRWHALAGEAYGSGPGHRALPDIKSLQAGVRQQREAGEKLVNPPLQGDARHQNEYLGMLPGDINWLPGIDAVGAHSAGLRPIFQVPPNITALADENNSYRRAIEATFYNDLILAISQMEGVQPRNQMEIQERRNEKMLMLGPMLERFYTEALSPVIRLVFARMQAVGILPPAPKQLHGRQIEPSFVSVLAQAQKSVGSTGLEQLLRFVGSMAGVWPGATQRINYDEVVEEYAEYVDANPKVLVPKEQAEAARAAMERQQQLQQAAEVAPKLAAGAQTLSETNVGGGQSALAAMLGRG